MCRYIRDLVIQGYAQLFAFVDCKVMILQGGLPVPKRSLFHIPLYADAIFIKPCQVVLPIPVTVVSRTACPPYGLGKILFHAQTIVIEISDLTFRKRIPLFCKYQVTLKTFLILLRVEVFFDQFIADIQLSARLVIAFRHGRSPRSFVCIIGAEMFHPPR